MCSSLQHSHTLGHLSRSAPAGVESPACRFYQRTQLVYRSLELPMQQGQGTPHELSRETKEPAGDAQQERNITWVNVIKK